MPFKEMAEAMKSGTGKIKAGKNGKEVFGH